MSLALRVALVTFAALLLAMVASLLTATRVATNGSPISVSLVYIEGPSNWGPQEATSEVGRVATNMIADQRTFAGAES